MAKVALDVQGNSMRAGAWRRIDGGPLQRDVVSGIGAPRTNTGSAP